jgi:hypothetical protein
MGEVVAPKIKCSNRNNTGEKKKSNRSLLRFMGIWLSLLIRVHSSPNSLRRKKATILVLKKEIS